MATRADRILLLAAAVALVLQSAGVAAQSTQEFLDAHNAARSTVNVAPLTWSDTLASYAQSYAQSQDGGSGSGCDGSLVHSGGPYGENLYQAWSSGGAAATPTDAVNSWVSEAQYYNYASNTCADGRQCGHYTQVVWGATTQVGCYLLACASVAGATYVMCSYDPPGNVVGERPY